MPEIPKYNGQRVQGAPLRGGYQQPTASPDEFGAVAARGMQQLGQFQRNVADTTQQFLMQDKIRTEKAQARDALNRAETEILNYLWGTPEEPGIYQRQGADAINVMDEARQKVSEIAKKYRQGLSGGRQQSYYDASANAVVQGTLGRVQYFQYKQRQLFDENTKKGQMEIATRKAAQDPTYAADADFIVRTNTESLYQGQPPEFIQARVAEAVNNLHISVVSGALARGDTDSAQKHLNAYKDVIDDIHEMQLAGEIQKQQIQLQANTEAEILAGSLLQTDAMKYIQSKYADKPVYRRALSRILKLVYAEKEAAKKQEREDMRAKVQADIAADPENVVYPAKATVDDVIEWDKARAIKALHHVIPGDYELFNEILAKFKKNPSSVGKEVIDISRLNQQQIDVINGLIDNYRNGIKDLKATANELWQTHLNTQFKTNEKEARALATEVFYDLMQFRKLEKYSDVTELIDDAIQYKTRQGIYDNIKTGAELNIEVRDAFSNKYGQIKKVFRKSDGLLLYAETSDGRKLRWPIEKYGPRYIDGQRRGPRTMQRELTPEEIEQAIPKGAAKEGWTPPKTTPKPKEAGQPTQKTTRTPAQTPNIVPFGGPIRKKKTPAVPKKKVTPEDIIKQMEEEKKEGRLAPQREKPIGPND